LLGTNLCRSWDSRWPVAERAAAPSGGSRCGSSSGVGCGEVVRLEGVVVRVGTRGGLECAGGESDRKHAFRGGGQGRWRWAQRRGWEGLRVEARAAAS
jgi:hypothetical protein